MHYYIKRNGETYGPYTLDDLTRYLGTGNVLPADLVKSEERPEWITVEQLLAAEPVASAPQWAPPAAAQSTATQSAAAQPGPSSIPYSQPVYTGPMSQSFAPGVSQYADAPNLHWGLVILFSVLTCGVLFTLVWDIVIAAWLRRVQPNDRSLQWYLGAAGVLILKWFGAVALGTALITHNSYHFVGFAAFDRLLNLVAFGLIVMGNFVKRASLEEHFNGPEPLGLKLDPVMTFFFAPWYFQYHLNRLNALKQSALYGYSGAPYRSQ